MSHREDPNRGVWNATCEFCGTDTRCRLVMHGDRYLWTCIGGCIRESLTRTLTGV